MTPDNSSVSVWLDQLNKGEQEAIQKIWKCYFVRLTSLARKKLQGVNKTVADEEDVALSAFHSFCQGAAEGRFPNLQDRNNLWSLLLTITVRKAHQMRLKQGRLKYGGDQVVLDQEEGAVEELLSREPSPEFAADLADQLHNLLDLVADPDLQSLIQLKLDGLNHEEIAVKQKCSVRSIERKMRIIRALAFSEPPS